jgi:hypothetical protein
MEFLDNLTNQQKRFALIGIVSVVGVFVLLFFVRGLSEVEFESNNAPSPTEERRMKTVESLMNDVLSMEYESYATYIAASDTYGSDPFRDIAERDAFSLGILIDLFNQYGYVAPQNDFLEKEIKLPNTVEEFCADALKMESKQRKVYDDVFATVDLIGKVDIEAAFYGFQRNAEEYHTPRLEACIK